MNLTQLGSHSLVIHFALDLLCFEEVRMILHDDTLGTTVHGLYLFHVAPLWHHCQPCGIVIFSVVDPFAAKLRFLLVLRSPVST